MVWHCDIIKGGHVIEREGMILMAKIKLLDDKTINKIAAGEVVDRPVSVVKELVENSIDAYSSNITIEIKKGGNSYIRITDNGLGIDKDDIQNAFLRHSTSKISKVEDLGNILTLGFRGEALASIAAVSRVEIVSKTRTSEMGQKLILHGGEVRENQEVGTTNGTTIIIRDLFFNVPVRKGFLKSEVAEASAINDFVYKLAISNPQISFTYIKDGKTELKTPGRGNTKETIYSVMGKDFIESTFDIDYEKKDIKVKGYISDLKYYRGNRANQFVFINGRIIKSELVSKAVEEIYKERIPIGKFPIFILFIELDPALTDVNMHPSKMEVKFRNEREVQKVIKQAVAEKLHSENLIPEVNLFENYLRDRSKEEDIKGKTEENYENIPVFEYIDQKKVQDNEETLEQSGTENDCKSSVQIDEPKAATEKADNSGQRDAIDRDILRFDRVSEKSEDAKYPKKLIDNKAIYRRGREDHGKIAEDSGVQTAFLENGDDDSNNESSSKTTVSANVERTERLSSEGIKESKKADKTIIEDISKNITVVGVIFNTYILCEDRINDEFLMIDQHAAHERILYEELREKYRNREVYTQEVIGSKPIELSLNDMTKLKNNTEVLESLGFTYEEFGENTVRIRSIPMIFGNPDTEHLFLDILDVLDIEGSSSENIYDRKLDKIMKQACTAAVKGGDRIMNMEIKALIDRLFKSENPYTCPHGRPITIKTSRKDIEKSFSRIQN